MAIRTANAAFEETAVQEAATIKSAAMRAVKELDNLLKNKALPSALRKQVQAVRTALRSKRWQDLADEAGSEPAEEAAVAEQWLDDGTAWDMVPANAYTFGDLADMAHAEQMAQNVQHCTRQYNQLVANVMLSDEIEDKAAALEALTAEFIGVLALAPEDDDAGELTEALAEAASGSLLSVEEATDGAPEGTLCMLEVALIEPGWGNEKDNHHYSREMLQRDAAKFEGAKMYATNHKSEEQTVRNEVSQIVKAPYRFTETGAPVGLAAVYDRDFEYSVRRRAEADTLGDLECSIYADGMVKEGYEQDGRKGKAVLSITEVKSVDWVARAGAGGRALSLVESDEGATMAKDTENVEERTEEEPVQEGEPVEIREGEEQPQSVNAPTVLKALIEAGLPPVVALRLAERTYETEDALTEAVAAAKAEVTAILESAKPPPQEPGSTAFGLTAQRQAPVQESQPDDGDMMDILRGYGMTVREEQKS